MESSDNLKTINLNYHNITVTIFVRVVIYCKELPPVKSLGLLIAWSCNFDFLSFNLEIENVNAQVATDFLLFVLLLLFGRYIVLFGRYIALT